MSSRRLSSLQPQIPPLAGVFQHPIPEMPSCWLSQRSSRGGKPPSKASPALPSPIFFGKEAGRTGGATRGAEAPLPSPGFSLYLPRTHAWSGASLNPNSESQRARENFQRTRSLDFQPAVSPSVIQLIKGKARAGIRKSIS